MASASGKAGMQTKGERGLGDREGVCQWEGKQADEGGGARGQDGRDVMTLRRCAVTAALRVTARAARNDVGPTYDTYILTLRHVHVRQVKGGSAAVTESYPQVVYIPISG